MLIVYIILAIFNIKEKLEDAGKRCSDILLVYMFFMLLKHGLVPDLNHESRIFLFFVCFYFTIHIHNVKLLTGLGLYFHTTWGVCLGWLDSPKS